MATAFDLTNIESSVIVNEMTHTVSIISSFAGPPPGELVHSSFNPSAVAGGSVGMSHHTHTRVGGEPQHRQNLSIHPLGSPETIRGCVTTVVIVVVSPALQS